MSGMEKNVKMHTITIDGKMFQAREDQTVLQVARENGINIPTLCYLEGISEVESCRLCVVEIEGVDKLKTACKTHVQRDGMVVNTMSERVIEARKMQLELLLSNHKLECFSCPSSGVCELQRLFYEYEISETHFKGSRAKIEAPALTSHPFLEYHPNLCIRCQRCVNTCARVSGRKAIELSKVGVFTVINTPFGEDWRESSCESCGNCAEACPVGALTKKNAKQYRSWEVKKVRTTCPHCATGCQFDFIVKNGKIVGVEGADGPSNHKRLCVKGRFGSYKFIGSPDRLTDPLIKDRATGTFRKASWEEALDLIASKFNDIKNTYGPDSLAGFACSRSANEDIYMLQKMVRCAFGTNNTDNCARVCHAPTVAGLARTLGSGAMTNTIEDITKDAEVIMLVGSNPEEAHPVIGMQLRGAIQRGTRLIVVDPRHIDIADNADIHLQLRPGTNVAFAHGIAHIIIEEGLIDEEFIKERTEVEVFEEYKKMVEKYTPEYVGEICHLDPDDLRAVARLYAKAKTAAIVYCLGVTEHSTGTEGVMSLSNLAMITGKYGKPGCGINPIRGQNNVQGACDMGAIPGDLPGYQKITNPEVREKFEKAWGVKLDSNPGLTATECFPAMLEGKIKGLFIFGEDPMRTDPNTHHVKEALETLDFLVVDDLFMTETAKMADVVLPGRAYGEKEGTFCNTERRFQRIRKAVEGPGNSRLDTDIFIDIMNKMGYAQPHLTSAEIMDEIASLTPAYAGISHARLDSAEVGGNGIQWPCPSKDHPGTPIMHVGKFSRGKGTYCVAEYRPSNELPDEEYPLIMMTGRNLYHYNATAMTDKTPELMDISGHSYIEVNSHDAAKAGIRNGERIKVISRRGTISSEARVSDKTSAGEVWMPFHFLDGNANWLTNNALDNICRAPEYKVCAVKIEKIADSEAFDEDGNYITQAMVAEKRYAQYRDQLKVPARCASGEKVAVSTEVADYCTK